MNEVGGENQVDVGATKERSGKRGTMLRHGGVAVVVVIVVAVVTMLIYRAATRLPLRYTSGDRPDSRPCRTQGCGEDGNLHWFEASFRTTFTATGEDTFRSTLDSGRYCDLDLHWEITLDGVPWREGDLPRAGQSTDLDIPLRGVRYVTLTATAPPPGPDCMPEVSWLARD